MERGQKSQKTGHVVYGCPLRRIPEDMLDRHRSSWAHSIPTLGFAYFCMPLIKSAESRYAEFGRHFSIRSLQFNGFCSVAINYCYCYEKQNKHMIHTFHSFKDKRNVRNRMWARFLRRADNIIPWHVKIFAQKTIYNCHLAKQNNAPLFTMIHTDM